jgi:threonine/homoserine/homoserine lactone efflux protein
MELNFLIKGMILGFSVAAPVGPIGILCIRRTLYFGRLSGFFSGLGAAVADTLYGAIAAFGVTVVSDTLLASHFWFRLFGGAFLILLGGKIFFSKTSEISISKVSHKTLISDFASTFALTITNPLTILSFVAVFAALGLSDVSDDIDNSVRLLAGIFLGSSLWWLFLSEGVTFFRKKISQKVMVWINRSAGAMISAFGLAAWISLIEL